MPELEPAAADYDSSSDSDPNDEEQHHVHELGAGDEAKTEEEQEDSAEAILAVVNAIEEEEDCRRDGGIGCQDADADVAGMGGLGLYEDTYRPGLEYCAGAYDMLEQAS